MLDDPILPPKDDMPPSDEDIKPIKEPTSTITPPPTIEPSGNPVNMNLMSILQVSVKKLRTSIALSIKLYYTILKK